MRLTEKTLALAALALAALATVACAPEKPATPSYARDVAPIFEAHCTRCHTSKNGGPLANPATGKTPLVCRLDFYDGDPATCAPADGGAPPPACWGAHFCATSFGGPLKSYINGVTDPMPPPPSTLLNDWERDIVERWVAACNPVTKVCTP